MFFRDENLGRKITVSGQERRDEERRGLKTTNHSRRNDTHFGEKTDLPYRGK